MDAKGASRGREKQDVFPAAYKDVLAAAPGSAFRGRALAGTECNPFFLSAAQQAARLQCHQVPEQQAPQQAPAAADWTASHPTPPVA